MKESYKEKYEQAIERAKAMIKVAANQDEAIGFTNTIFPELAESEDEKTRKELICFLETEVVQCSARDKYIDWLEKQAEQKPIWTDYDRIMALTLLRDIDQMAYISKEEKDERLEWLHSLDDKFKKE